MKKPFGKAVRPEGFVSGETPGRESRGDALVGRQGSGVSPKPNAPSGF